MKTRSWCVLIWVLCCCANFLWAGPEETAVLQAARALDGNGFETRAGLWTGSLAPGKAQDVELYLFPENEYCFLIAGANPTVKIELILPDGDGEVVVPLRETGESGGVRYLLVRPQSGGQHILRIPNEGEHPVSVTVGYAYR